jgi:hypothetical protein
VIAARHLRPALLGATVLLSGCGMEAMEISLEATEAASSVFKRLGDEARIARDARASRRLGQLCGSNQLATGEVQALKRIVAEAKADATVTPEEADRILVEMERVVELHRP